MSADAMLSKLITDDELYCARNLKIRTKEGAILPFIWNDAQRILHARLEEQLSLRGWIRAIVLKGRQQGCSTYVAARFYKRTCTNFGKRTMILTHLDGATQNLFGMVKTFFDLSDSTLRPKVKANSGTELSFEKLRSGYKVATAGSKNAGRSDTVQYLHGSEMAFWPNASQIMMGLGQTVPMADGSEMILESTANGLANLFRKFWLMAVSGKSDYMPVFIPWFVQKEYRRKPDADFELSEEDIEYQDAYALDIEQMAWRRAKTDTDFAGDSDQFNQEYPASPDLAFLKVGHKPLINTLKVQLARKKLIAHMQRVGAHVVGLDPARFGDDDSVFIHRQGRVAWGTEHMDGADTMEVAGRAARMLTDDPTIRMMFIDIGGLGAGIYDRLVELGFGDRVTAVNFGSSASDSRKYFNKRTEMWGELAEWLHDKITPCIPDEDLLHADLTSPSFTYSSNGQKKLDPKEKIKAELGRSPDDGDALALTFAEPVAADDTFTEDWKAKLMRRNSRKSAMGA
ncbi:hypothetical protein ACVBEG_03145 [Pseudomonas sp. GG8]